MKKEHLILIIVVFTSLITCRQPEAIFTEPQPENTDNLLNFPKHLQGEYLSLSDSIILKINSSSIQKIYDCYDTISSSKLSDNFRIIDDTLIDIETNERSIFKKEKNKIITHLYFYDTLFLINQAHLLRKLKSNYFLNSKYQNEGWEINKLQLIKGKLLISSISTKDDEIKETDKIEEKELPYKLSMTKKYFKEFVKNNGFNSIETFVKLK